MKTKHFPRGKKYIRERRRQYKSKELVPKGWPTHLEQYEVLMHPTKGMLSRYGAQPTVSH
jgi:hypothetical protein